MTLWHHWSSLGIWYTRVAGARAVCQMFRIHPRVVMPLLELAGSVVSRSPHLHLVTLKSPRLKRKPW